MEGEESVTGFGCITIRKDLIKYVSVNQTDGFEITPKDLKKVDGDIRSTDNLNQPFVLVARSSS